jgi:hypothetical protein
MKLFYKKVWALLFLTTLVHASEIHWITFQLNHSYKDLETNCYSDRSGGRLYFAMEIESSKVVNARIIKPYYSKSISLSKEELAKIEPFVDKKGRYWLKTLLLDESSLKWGLYNGSHQMSLCELPLELASVQPKPILYEFELEGFEEDIFVSYSQKEKLKGNRIDGKNFDASMQWIQREYKGSSL